MKLAKTPAALLSAFAVALTCAPAWACNGQLTAGASSITEVLTWIVAIATLLVPILLLWWFIKGVNSVRNAPVVRRLKRLWRSKR